MKRKTRFSFAFHSTIRNFAAGMRQVLLTTRILTALCAMFLTVMFNWQSSSDVSVEESYHHEESSVVAPQHQHHQEATLTDASQIYRICSSRPQRVLPTQGSKTERTNTPFGCSVIRRHIVKPLYSYYDSRCRVETAPFCTSASSDYYVIALRHIIR